MFGGVSNGRACDSSLHLFDAPSSEWSVRVRLVSRCGHTCVVRLLPGHVLRCWTWRALSGCRRRPTATFSWRHRSNCRRIRSSQSVPAWLWMRQKPSQRRRHPPLSSCPTRPSPRAWYPCPWVRVPRPALPVARQPAPVLELVLAPVLVRVRVRERRCWCSSQQSARPSHPHRRQGSSAKNGRRPHAARHCRRRASSGHCSV